jgi:hypothetical protein
MTEDDVNRAFSQFPCLGCEHPHRQYALTFLAEFYLCHERGAEPKVPTRQELFARCCRNDHRGEFTYLKPGSGEDVETKRKPWGRW